MYLTRPGTIKGDTQGLLSYVNSSDYYDNWMTRMLANIPRQVAVTEEHFREARMILENKFIIGMTSDMHETVQKRIKLYFGWKESPKKQGCELEHIKEGIMNLPPTALVEGGEEWRKITKRNLFDMKLYARGMAVFGNQKMRLPVHSLVVEDQRKVVMEALGHLRDVNEWKEKSDVPFFW